ncbi:MAG: DUF2231 domain-containing protein [Acidimicrobiia bacterium]
MIKALSFRPGLDLRGKEFRGWRGWAGKPLHPPLTDLPIGAYIIAPVLDVISYFGSGSSWAGDLYRAAGYLLLAGAVVSLATALTGFLDWLHTTRGSQVRRLANAHAWTMITMSVLVLIDLWVRFLGPEREAASGLVVVLGVLIAGLATLGGTLGGTLVYGYGFNVETADHDHPAFRPTEHEVPYPSGTSHDG